MNLTALILCIALSSPSAPLLPKVFQGESVAGSPSVKTNKVKPKRPWAPLGIIATGFGLMAAGLIGMNIDQGCQTRDADLRCTDPRGGSVIMPSMVILGLALTVTGEHWRRTTEPREP